MSLGVVERHSSEWWRYGGEAVVFSRIVVKFYLVCIHGTFQSECTVTIL